jgi:diacylglycerol kinase (ATP)
VGSIPTRPRHLSGPREGVRPFPGVLRKPISRLLRETRSGGPLPDSLSTAVILNPAASGGSGHRTWPRVEAELSRRGIDFALFRTEGPGHATELSREAAKLGAERILVVGGDGTLHEVANGLLDGSVPFPPLAVVPVGTGNDFYRMVGSSRKIEDAVGALVDGSVHMFDVGWIRHDSGERHFVNLLGVGVDVEVLRARTKFHRLRGLPQYLAALVWTLATFRPDSFRISLGPESPGEEPESFQGRTLLAVVTVGPSIGGGFHVNPGASPEDGLLNLFQVGPLGFLKVARYVPRVIRGTHGDVPDIRLRKFVSAVLEREGGEPFYFEMDGERMPDPVTRMTVEVRPAVLPVLLPRRPE